MNVPVPGDRIEFTERVNDQDVEHTGDVITVRYSLSGAVDVDVHCDDDIWRTARLVNPFTIVN